MGLLRASIPTRSIKTRSRELASYADVGRGRMCQTSMSKNELFLGVDGGGTRCRARLCDASGLKLAEAQAGPANIRLGLKEAFASVLDVTLNCLEQAHLSSAGSSADHRLPGIGRRDRACRAGCCNIAQAVFRPSHPHVRRARSLRGRARRPGWGGCYCRHGQHRMGRGPRQAPPCGRMGLADVR